jgi:hypothetical protein
MQYEQLSKDHARVSGIASPAELQRQLAAQGKFSKDFALYTVETPLGDVETKLDWKPSSVDVRLKKKPMFVPASTIFARLKEEVEKAPPSA